METDNVSFDRSKSEGGSTNLFLDERDEKEIRELCSRTKYDNVVERYYTQYYALDVNGKQDEDHYVYQHLNKLFIVGIAPTHIVRKQHMEVENVSFSVGNVDYLKNKVSGTKKKGGKYLNQLDPICEIRCVDGSRYIVRACCQGFLLEVNAKLLENPNLLLEKGDTDGYIAIIQPKKTNTDYCSKNLLSLEQFKQSRSLTNKS